MKQRNVFLLSHVTFTPGWTEKYQRIYGLLSAAILNGSDNGCSSWTMAQVDNWKHLISDKYIILFLFLCNLPFRTRNDQNEMFLLLLINSHSVSCKENH